MSGQYIKMKVNFEARLRLLSSSEETPVFYGGREFKPASCEDLLRGSNIPEALGQFLFNIDAKLDAVLSALRRDELARRFEHEANVVEISGDSMAFISTCLLKKEAFAEAVLFLGDFPPRQAGVVGKIVSLDTHGDKFRYGMKFTSVTEADQDAIIQYIFQVERRILREKSRC